jgi:mono/diheme cytochrome c family protein
LLTVALFALGCGEPEPALREWQPSDHQSPHRVFGDRRAAPPESEQAEDPAQVEIRAATALFQSLCASCHGSDGRGGGPARPPAAIPDLTSEELQAGRTDAELAAAIREGRGPFMPAFGDRLSAQGIAALVRHVRRLGGREGGAEPPPSERSAVPSVGSP